MATTDDIKNWVEIELAEVRSYVRSKNRTWLIVASLVFVLIVIIFWTVFSKKDKEDPRLEQFQQQIEHLQKTNVFLDSMIKEKDTLYIENRKTETRIIERHDKIPADIKSLDREQLRREVTNF
jgi:predicted negative regulator of RcsB-dependent stress response